MGIDATTRATTEGGMNHQTTRLIWAIVTHNPRLSAEEIAKQAGLRSKSTAAYHLRRLERIGYIERTKGVPRSIRVIMPFCVSDLAAFKVAVRSSPRNISAVKELALCAVCNQPINAHPRCANCHVLIGPGHVFWKIENGRCSRCAREQRRAA